MIPLLTGWELLIPKLKFKLGVMLKLNPPPPPFVIRPAIFDMPGLFLNILVGSLLPSPLPPLISLLFRPACGSIMLVDEDDGVPN